MARKRHYKAKSKEVPEMDITTFLNLMVVLVPFLLASAVFSRITILELNLPAAAAPGVAVKPKVTIEVIVRKLGLQIGNGKGVVAVFPQIEDKYDTERLGLYLKKIKENYPDKTDATILLEPDIEYSVMVLIMDAVRSVELKSEDSVAATVPGAPILNSSLQVVALFPDMSIGEAP
jgi:biopolymer transport protein ExbD